MCETPPSQPTSFLEQVAEHRKLLQTMRSEMQSEYDKGVMALSGGALGISLTFLKEFVPRQNIHGTNFLISAWVCWGLSVTIVVFSYFTSAVAFGKAINQTDENLLYFDAIEHGGLANKITRFLNPFAGGLFAVGLVLLLFFAGKNL
jgi:hypothetical protein